ncbi:hypothetical protein ACFFRR_010071 [Megaselia abdita]
MLLQNITILLLNICVLTAFQSHNLTEWRERRQKRHLIFANGGINKLVGGFSYPVNLGDKKEWRQLNCAWNFQAQYSPPTTPLYWWDKWDGRNLMQARRLYDEFGTYVEDQSSRFVYLAIETLLDRRGSNGKECLMKAFCENAQSYDEYNTVVSVMIKRIFKPGDTDDPLYVNAYKIGELGMDCERQFPKCPYGDGVFDGIFMKSIYDYSV